MGTVRGGRKNHEVGVERLYDSGSLVAGDLIPDRALTAADSDEFAYVPIADRIADLCSEAEAPVNVAIFSPWGSGKSSLCTLIEASLNTRSQRIKLIRYDAWRYGGRALRRNFIAHAARALHLPDEDPRYADLHRGLYEDQRRISLNGYRIWRALTHGKLALIALLVLILVLVGLLLSINSLLISALLSTVLVLIAAVVNAGKVEVEESKPSEDEEFSARFERLVDLATAPERITYGARRHWREWWAEAGRNFAINTRLYRGLMWWRDEPLACHLDPPRFERLVFFIDELDRCSRADIAETLKALRTFLDAKRCVFLVAADREVIEEALSEVEQATPINAEMPHYSSAGAFLDKIFQHQISLPPLRSRSLAKFARQLTLTAGADGIWGELVAMDEGDATTPTLDFVLFTLIPSHVHSPRRIKVLLNNYATNVRLARSRLEEIWPAQACELAQLTALQTEFPDFAADLPIEPRLPRYLLEVAAGSDPGQFSTKVRELLDRWKLDPPTSAGEADGGEGSEERADPDHLMVGDTEADKKARKRALLEAERQRRAELRRYLERTRDVAGDLRRELFYLQSAGVDVGLDDPQLAELIETETTDSPDLVIDALADRSRAELQGVARLLSSMVGDVLGPEQKRVMDCLMVTVETLQGGTSAVAAEVSGALRTYWAAHELSPNHLVGALRTAISARDLDPGLAAQVVGEDRLWQDWELVVAAIPLAPALRDSELDRLRGGIAFCLPGAPKPILAALGELSPYAKRKLMKEPEIFSAFGEMLDRQAEEDAVEDGSRESSEELVHALLGPSLDGIEGEKIVAKLYVSGLQKLDREPINRYLAEHRSEILDRLLEDPSAQTTFLLRGWLASDPEEWSEWAERLDGKTLAQREFRALATELAAEIVGAVARERKQVEDADTLLRKLSPALEQVDHDDMEAHLAPAVEEVLAAREWWTGEDVLRVQADVHEVVRQVEDVCPASAETLQSMRSKDVLNPAGEEGTSVGDLLVLRGWRELGHDLTRRSYWRLQDAVPGPDAALDPGLQAEALATRLVLHQLDRFFQGSPSAVSNYISEIRSVQKLDGDYRSQIRIAAAACIDLSPSAVQMQTLIRIVYAADEGGRKAVARWARREGRTSATTLVKRLIDDGFYWDWMPAFREVPYEEAPVIRVLRAGLLDKASDNPVRKRKRRARSFAKLGVRTKTGQEEIIKLVVALLGSKRFQNDLEVMLILCPVLGASHGRSGKVEAALIGYSKRWKHKFTPSENEALLAAGIRLPEDYLSKKAKSGMKGMLAGIKAGAEETMKAITQPR